MDRLDQMETFVQVVESGGISAAAERMGIAKSAVSRRLSELENRLDARLLQRTTRRLNLTDSGRLFYQQCRRLLEEIDDAEQELSSDQQTLRGELRLNVPLSFGIRHLAPILARFMHDNPELALDIALDDREVNLIEEGVDVLLRVGRLEDTSLIARRLCPIDFQVVAAPDYLARHGTPQSLAELEQHQAIGYTLMADSRFWTLQPLGGRPLRLKPPIRLHANNGDLILQAAEEGLGIAVVPTFISHRAVADGRLLPLCSDTPLQPLHLYALYSSRHHLPRRVRAFVDVLADAFAAGPPWQSTP